jgi:predicted transcriptional regulator
MENFNVAEVTKTTAKNMYELLMQLANHIEKLQTENEDLKKKLRLHDDDLK